MRSVTASIVGLIAFTAFAPLALAAPPAAPVVTVGADIKQLQFDWESVPSTTRYELWFKASNENDWIKYTEIPGTRAPRFRIGVSVHLLDWRVAQYRVAACNASGCTNSAPVGVSGLANDAVGYFKPQASTSYDFGSTVALSADGQTFAVINGETLGSAKDSATVYVYRKTSSTASTGGWRREARLLPSSIGRYTNSDTTLALSADGNVLALGIPDEATSTVNPNPPGAVYVYRRTGTSWQLEQKLRGISGHSFFGAALDLADSGQRLVVTSDVVAEDDPRVVESGIVNVFERGDGGWQRTQLVPPSHRGAWDDSCGAISLSGDGQTLVRACVSGDFYNPGDPHVQVYHVSAGTASLQGDIPTANKIFALDLDYSGTKLALRVGSFGVDVWQSNSGVWSKDGGTLPTGEGQMGVTISRDGKFVAGVGRDDAPGNGVLYPPLGHGAPSSVSVYVYQRFSRNWGLRRVVKPTVSGRFSDDSPVALGDNGRTLLVGSRLDSSAASGIGGDPTDASAPRRGAAWLY